MHYIYVLMGTLCVLKALTLGRQEVHPACNKLSSLWGEVQICIQPSRYHCHSLSVALVNPDWFYLPGFTFLVLLTICMKLYVEKSVL